MANARSLVLTAGGRTQEARDADVQVVSGTVQNGSGALTINAAATQINLEVGGTAYLTVSSTAVSLGVVLNANSNKITTLAAPTAGSSDAATALYAEAQKTGGVVTLATFNRSATWTHAQATGPMGLAEGASGVIGTVLPLQIPVAGKLKNFQLQAIVPVGSPANITVYQAAQANSPSYAATSAVIALGATDHFGFDKTHTITVAAGDLFEVVTDTDWSGPGLIMTAQFIPDAA